MQLFFSSKSQVINVPPYLGVESHTLTLKLRYNNIFCELITRLLSVN